MDGKTLPELIGELVDEYISNKIGDGLTEDDVTSILENKFDELFESKIADYHITAQLEN